MTKSSVKKLGLTRRVVASSGIAAALFAASPVAVALADDGGAGSGTSVEKTDDGTDSVDVEDDSGSGGPESADSGASGSGTGDAGASDGGTSEAGAEGSPASTGVPGDSTADDTGETETAVAEPVSGDPSEPGATGPEPSTTTSVPTQGAPVTGSQLGSPVVADSDAHDAPTTPPRHRLPGGRHAATPAPAAAGQPRTGQGAGTVAGGSELIEIPVGAIESPEEPEGLIGKLFYRLTGGSGTEGLILVNQAAVVAGVLNRRSRHDGSDYLGLVGPGEKQFIPKATIAELVLGRHAPKADLESFDLTASSVPNALARSLIAVAAQVAPDDRFWQTDDPATTGYWPADGVGIHDENVYYTVDDGAIVVHNDSDHDIAVSVYSTADGSTLQFDELVVIGAGQTHSSSATDDRSRVIVVQAPKETTGPNAGKAQIYGAILRVAPSAGSPGYVLPYDAYFGDGVPGLSDPVWGPLDPDDHFWSPNEALTAAVAGDNHGVHYGYSAEDGTITFTNDSDETVAVVAYDAFLQPVGPGMAILAPGQSATLQVPPTGQVAYMVQQERDASGAIRIIGALTSVDGQVSPASGQYPLKTDAEYALDPDDRFWDVKEGTSSVSNGVLPSTMVGANGVAEGIYYTRDGDIVTIHNDSDHDIAVSWMANDQSHSEFVVIAPGGTYDTPTAASGGTGFAVVQGPKATTGTHAGVPVVYGVIAHSPGTVQSLDPIAGDGNPALTLGDWRGIDPGDRYWTPADSDETKLVASNTTIPRFGDRTTLTGAGVAYALDDAGQVVITNNGTAPISVIEYDSTHQPVAFHLIEAGGSQTFTPDSDGYNYRTTAYVVQEERNTAGQPVLAGIITAASVGGDTWLDGADGTDFPTNESPWVQIVQTGTTTGVLYGFDPDADVITYSVSTEPEHGTVTLAPYLGGNFAGTTLYVYTYTPSPEAAHAAAAGGATQDFFEVSYTDGYGQAQTIRVDVGIVGQNAAPAGPSAVSGGETGSLGVTDPDGDTLTYEVTTQPASGGAVVDSSGTYTYIPATAPVHGETLQDSFEVTVRDGHGGVLVVPVSVSITANQAPTVTEVVQDGYTGTIVAADADDDELQFDVTSDPTYGKVVVGPDGSFVYTPDAGVEHAAAGGGVTSDSFVVTVSDGHGGLTPVTVNVGIDPANESPSVATSQGAPSAETGAVVVSVVTADADADAVTVTTTDPAHGTLTDNGDGTLTYTPDPVKRAAGDFTDSFTVTVDDGHGGTATKTVTVTVTKPVVVEPEQPTRSVFDQLVSAIRSGFSSVSSAVSQAWQSFLTWLQSLFANNNTTRV